MRQRPVTLSIDEFTAPLRQQRLSMEKETEEKRDDEAEIEAEFIQEDDPYEVMDERFKRVTKAEYQNSLKCPIHPSVSFNIDLYTKISSTAFLSKKTYHPITVYQHDPIHLVDACAIAFNIELEARRMSSQISRQHLQVIQNNDTTPLLNLLSEDQIVRRSVLKYEEEFVAALMAVQEATSYLPKHVEEAFSLHNQSLEQSRK